MSICRRAYARPQPRSQHGRHYLCVCVHSDVYRQVRQLSAEHQLSLFGARRSIASIQKRVPAPVVSPWR